MQKIIIKNFATIQDLQLVLDKRFQVVIGEQASGKSTLAKMIYFCRKVKDYVLEFLTEQKNFTSTHPNEYFSSFLKYIRRQFMGCFGTTKHMRTFQIEFIYNWSYKTINTSPNLKKITLTLDRSGYVKITFSKDIANAVRTMLQEAAQLYQVKGITSSNSWDTLLEVLQTRQMVREHFAKVTETLFGDEEEILYIPAGRSVLATLSEQLHDLNVDTLDLPLREFILLIQTSRKKFGTKIPDIISNYTKMVDGRIRNSDVEMAYALIRQILRGDYVSESDGEKLYYSETEYVKLMYASSGQQEVLWILLLIFIRILEQKRVFLVLEEPEAHLFPSAQRKIMELIALLVNSTGSSVFITTHSPYILTATNLCVYSAKVESTGKNHAYVVIPRMLRLEPRQMDAFRISNQNGFSFSSIKDTKEQLIDAAQIDEISGEINEQTDRIMELECQNDL